MISSLLPVSAKSASVTLAPLSAMLTASASAARLSAVGWTITAGTSGAPPAEGVLHAIISAATRKPRTLAVPPVLPPDVLDHHALGGGPRVRGAEGAGRARPARPKREGSALRGRFITCPIVSRPR